MDMWTENKICLSTLEYLTVHSLNNLFKWQELRLNSLAIFHTHFILLISELLTEQHIHFAYRDFNPLTKRSNCNFAFHPGFPTTRGGSYLGASGVYPHDNFTLRSKTFLLLPCTKPGLHAQKHPGPELWKCTRKGNSQKTKKYLVELSRDFPTSPHAFWDRHAATWGTYKGGQIKESYKVFYKVTVSFLFCNIQQLNNLVFVVPKTGSCYPMHKKKKAKL